MEPLQGRTPRQGSPAELAPWPVVKRKPKESRKRQAFIRHVRTTNSPTEAARKAGYGSPEQRGSELMRVPEIQDELAAQVEQDIVRTNLKAADVITAINEIANGDVTDCFEWAKPSTVGMGIVGAGRMVVRDLTALPAHVRRCIKSIRVKEDGDVTVTFWDKNKALELLAKHFRLVSEHIDINITARSLEKLSDEDLAKKAQEVFEEARAQALLRLAVSTVK